MAPHAWKIGIISTVYDNKKYRRALKRCLESQGFEVLLSEDRKFPVAQGMHSHDACLTAMRGVDAAVLIINRRYGGTYQGSADSRISITEKEYDTLREAGIPVLALIHNEAWEDRHRLKKSIARVDVHGGGDAESTGSSGEAALQYVDSQEVIRFIDKIHRGSEDNWLSRFGTAKEACESALARLRSLATFFLKQLVPKLVEEVRRRKTTTAMAFSLGEVLDGGYYVSPPFKLLSGLAGENCDLAGIMEVVPAEEKRVAIYGDPGSGKSTALAKGFIAHAEQYLAGETATVPVFTSLRGRTGGFHFGLGQILAECFERSLSKTTYPLLSTDDIPFATYLDGFDEVGGASAEDLSDSFMNSDLIHRPLAITARSRFADIYLNDNRIGDQFSHIVELQTWSPEVARRYVDSFCRNRGREDAVRGTMEALEDGSPMCEIAGNPLFLTLLMWVMEQAQMDLPLGVRDKSTLLDKALELWARRDIQGRDDSDGNVPESELLRCWEVAAWEICRARFQSDQNLTIGALCKAVAKVVGLPVNRISGSEAFRGLLEIRAITSVVPGMRHEQILEHLAGRCLSGGMTDGTYPFPESLRRPVHFDVTRALRALWRTVGEDVLTEIRKNLWKHYVSLVGDDDPESVVSRNQAMYYLGRIELPDTTERLKKADKMEDAPFVRLAIQFGLVKRSDLQTEAELYERLANSPDWDGANRGYHLLYYRDWLPSAWTPPFIDPGDCPWKNTLAVLLKHLSSNSGKHVAMRRIELLTIRRLLETRHCHGPLSQDAMDRIEQAVTSTVNIPDAPDFVRSIEEEFARLKQAYEHAAPE